MQDVRLTEEEKQYLTDAEIQELLSSKVLDAWGVPMKGLTVYGRLQWLDTWYPEIIEIIKKGTKNKSTP